MDANTAAAPQPTAEETAVSLTSEFDPKEVEALHRRARQSAYGLISLADRLRILKWRDRLAQKKAKGRNGRSVRPRKPSPRGRAALVARQKKARP